MKTLFPLPDQEEYLDAQVLQAAVLPAITARYFRQPVNPQSIIRSCFLGSVGFLIGCSSDLLVYADF